MDLSGSPVAAFVSPTIDFDERAPPGRTRRDGPARFTPPRRRRRTRFSLRTPCVVRLYVDGTARRERRPRGSSDCPVPAPPAVHGAGDGDRLRPPTCSRRSSSSTRSALRVRRLALARSAGRRRLDRAALPTRWPPRAAADAAIVFVNDVTYEGMDRTHARRCRATRTTLIAAVAAANPRTIVVLHTRGTRADAVARGRRGA